MIAIQEEIMFRGPVSLGFDVYEDFLNYKTGEQAYTVVPMS